MSRFLLIVLAIPVVNALWWAWADRRLRPLKRRKLWRTLLAAFMSLQLLLFASMMTIRAVDAVMPSTQFIWSMTYLWHLVVLPIFATATLAVELVRGSASIVRKIRHKFSPTTSEPSGDGGLSRREALALFAAAPPVFTIMGTAYGLTRLDDFRIRRIDVPIPNLPRELEGMKIAHVADIHVGTFTEGKVLRRIADATNDLRSDLVLMAGDLINSDLADLGDGIDTINRMEGRHGVFMVEGNHDLFESRSEFENRVKAAGIPLLLNETATVEHNGRKVQVLGLKWGGRGGRRVPHYTEHLQELLPVRDPEAFQVLLSHHPHAFDDAAQVGIPLTLAGHTHGGQLMLTDQIGAGPWMFKYWSGLYQKQGASLVVSNGVGNWFPLRTNAPAELIEITLRSA